MSPTPPDRADLVKRLLTEVEAILDGIDRDECEEGGWWETSTGVKHGADCLARIRQLLSAAALEAQGLASVVAEGWLMEHIEQHLLALTSLKKRTDSMPVMTEWQWVNNLRNRLQAALAATPASPAPVVAPLRDALVNAYVVGYTTRGPEVKANPAQVRARAEAYADGIGRHAAAPASPAAVEAVAPVAARGDTDLRDALHLIIGVTEGVDCPGLDRPTDFAIAQSRGIRLGTIRRVAVAARAALAAPTPAVQAGAEAPLREACIAALAAFDADGYGKPRWPDFVQSIRKATLAGIVNVDDITGSTS